MSFIPCDWGFRRIRSASSNPFITGIWTSRIARRNGVPSETARAINASAISPPSATVAFRPHFASPSTRIRRLVALSSTTSTFMLWSHAGVARRLGAGGGAVAKSAVKWNVLPRPTSLSTQMRPLIIFTSLALMVRPRPVPPKCRVVDPSAWVKASKIFRCFSGAIPIPVSIT